VTVRGGCPASVDYGTDVSNPGSRLTATLVPPQDRPTHGLVCVYPEPRSYIPPRPPTREVIALYATGTTSCPGGDENITVIVVSYAGRADVDLRYNAFGCRDIDNGYVGAFQAANMPFGNAD
jgi:hypothetical protein